MKIKTVLINSRIRSGSPAETPAEMARVNLSERFAASPLRKIFQAVVPVSLLVVAPVLSHAQSISTTGLVDHFDPSSGLSTNGDGAVTGWVNQADNNRSVGTPGRLETNLVLSENFPPMIQFNSTYAGSIDSSSALTYASPGSAALESGYTTFLVFNLTSNLNSGLQYKRLWRGANDAQGLYFDRGTTSAVIKANPVGAADRPRSNYLDTYALNEIAILTARVTPTSQELYFNGQLVDSRSVSVASYAIDNAIFEIGNGLDVGQIGHVLVYDNRASMADLNRTGVYLAGQYGTSWAVIPEPSTTALLLGLGAVGMLIITRVRRRNRTSV